MFTIWLLCYTCYTCYYVTPGTPVTPVPPVIPVTPLTPVNVSNLLLIYHDSLSKSLVSKSLPNSAKTTCLLNFEVFGRTSIAAAKNRQYVILRTFFWKTFQTVMTEYVKWPNKLYPTDIVSRGRFELRNTCAILDPTIWKTFVCITKPCSSVKG